MDIPTLLIFGHMFLSAHENGESRYSPTPDDDVFRQLALAYAIPHPEMTNDEVCLNIESFGADSFLYGITNGAHWYPIPGITK